MEESKLSLGRALIKFFTNSSAGEMALELAEVALDQGIAEGVLREIPVLGGLIKATQATRSYADAIFLRKLTRFLVELSSVTVQERELLLEKYPDNSEEQQDLGENLILALERLDDVKKPAILARFFAAYVKEQIDYVTFTRLASALEKFNMELLPDLCRHYTIEEPEVGSNDEIVHELSLAGLVTVRLAGKGSWQSETGFRSSELGRRFLLIGFDVQSPANH